MIKYLEKWMYVNDIENQNLLKIAELIEKNKKKPEIFTSQAEVLYYFRLLINWKLSLQTFLLFRDTYFFPRKHYKYTIKNSLDAIYYIKALSPNLKKDKIFIFDNLYKELIKKEGLKNCYTV